MKLRTAIPAALIAMAALTACSPAETIQRIESVKGVISTPAKAKRVPVPQCCHTPTTVDPNEPPVDPNAMQPRSAP